MEGRHPGRAARPGAATRASVRHRRGRRRAQKTVWDDASFKQVEDGVAKLPADADEVVLRCMVHAVNTSDSLQAAEVAVILRASELAFASAVLK